MCKNSFSEYLFAGDLHICRAMKSAGGCKLLESVLECVKCGSLKIIRKLTSLKPIFFVIRKTNIIHWSWDSSVGIGTGYGLDGRGSTPGRDNIFLFFTASRRALRPTQPPIQRAPGVLSSRIKRPGCEAGHLPPSSAEVKNGGAILQFPCVFMA
jgi:hypothetical protein